MIISKGYPDSVEMPFRSKAQMRLCFTGRTGLSKEECRQIARQTPRNIPEYVGDKKGSKRKTKKRSPSKKSKKSTRSKKSKKSTRSKRKSTQKRFVFRGSRGGRYIKVKGRKVYI